MFTNIHLLTSGAYGKIYICLYKDKIKAVKTVEYSETDCLAMKSIIRESFLFKNLSHKNLLNSRDIIHSKGKIHYILDLYSHNLGIEINNWNNNEYSGILYKKIIKQIFLGLNYLHKNNIIHRDLKPENILLNDNYKVKITDYGICKLDGNTNNNIEHVEYVQTIWYRSPEVLLLEFANTKSDIWSMGCIMFEILTKREEILFGYKTAREVLCAILKTFKKDNISKEKLKIYELDKINIMEDCEKFNLENRLKKYQKQILVNIVLYIDLIKKILVFEPNTRLSAKDCLEHNFFKNYKSKDLITNKKTIYLNKDISFIDNYHFRNNNYTEYLLNFLKSQ